jgi:hypothetical protein
LARYGGDHDPPVTACATSDETLFPLEILPRRTGPFFDGWEAILLDVGSEERFIYRDAEADVMEAVWAR